jgi:hypothetical protein
MPAAPRAEWAPGIVNFLYLSLVLFFIDFAFPFVLVFVFGLLFPIFGHFLH